MATKEFTLECPLPITDYPAVTLAHGGGGKLMHQLLEKMILPAFESPLLDTRHDGREDLAGPASLQRREPVRGLGDRIEQ